MHMHITEFHLSLAVHTYGQWVYYLQNVRKDTYWQLHHYHRNLNFYSHWAFTKQVSYHTQQYLHAYHSDMENLFNRQAIQWDRNTSLKFSNTSIQCKTPVERLRKMHCNTLLVLIHMWMYIYCLVRKNSSATTQGAWQWREGSNEISNAINRTGKPLKVCTRI